MEIHAYSDGGCSGNPGPGGWAYVLVIDGNKKTNSGGEPATTNNRMELRAVIYALKDLHSHEGWRGANILFHTDSQYVKKGITEWIGTWERNGWRTSAKKPVKNQDLWRELRSVSSELRVDWRWVKGHAGDPMNELCDSLVQGEIRRL
ncbi:MAG: ribonuclease HI [Spirochaetales bacterium]|jgi:ribonuclease HI|nr:ribonuclease HI [Spirochaetales bacterium]